MKIIKMVKTSYDGKLHESVKAAEKHLDKLYGDKIRVISHAICKFDGARYVAIGDYIDENLHLFIELAKIKADMELPASEEDTD